MTTLEARVQALEDRTEALAAQLARRDAPELARRDAPELPRAAVFAPPRPAAEPARQPAPPAPPVARAPRPALEDLLGGRVLAWVGGVAVTVGVLLLLAIAVSNGWIGEGARTAMATVASLGLLVLGAVLHERRGRTDAALAAAAAGVVGLFGSLAVAGQVYDLVPSLSALVLALGVGAAATTLAVRWRAPGFGALGICGALVAPVLVGADGLEAATLALVAVATAAATGVLLRERWSWLAYATVGLAAPQWLWWLLAEQRPAAAIVTVLAGFGVLHLLAAAGFELRSKAPALRASAVFLLALNALLLGSAGYFELQAAGVPVLAHLWLVALAVAHLAAALAGGRSRRVSHELALVCAGLGFVLADVAFTTIASGPVLVLGWSAAGAAFAGWARRRAKPGEADRRFGDTGMGAHLTLAMAHALAFDGSP